MPPISYRQFFVPFTKVDKPKRIVWGIAQSEDVDSQDDMLTYESSVDAFGAWAGNIREQHDATKAVGKAIEIVADPKRRLITVGARVSLGAEDTWQKVLDGTLGGFSIGGVIQEAEFVHSKELDRTIRKVSKYELYELSLVDVPANAHCVITAVEKRGKTLVATDVLGQSLGALTASDVLNSKKESPPMAKRAKVKPVIEFIAKAASANEEFVLVKKSDFSKGSDNTFVLKGDATVSQTMTKEDFDADGYSDQSDDTSGDGDTPAAIDYEKNAENLALAHKDMCMAGGIDDNEAHYLETTRAEDKDDLDDPKDDDAMGEDDKAIKAKRARREKALSTRRAASAAAATPSKLEAEVDSLKSQISELTAMLKGQGVAPRIGDAAASGAGESVSKTVVGAGTGDLARLQGELQVLNARQTELLAKPVRKASDLSADERREREHIGSQILHKEEQISYLQRISR